MYGIQEITHFFYGIADKDSEEIVSVFHTVTNTCDNSVYILQNGCIFNTGYVFTTIIFQIFIFEYRGNRFGMFDIAWKIFNNKK